MRPMQLVDQKSRSSHEELEPILYAALIDSMFQNFWPMFLGGVVRGHRRGDDRRQDRQSNCCGRARS